MAGNKRSGRRCDWFLERCAEIIDDEKLLDFVARVATGKETEQKPMAIREGKEIRYEIVEVKASIQDRLNAFKMLAEWGIGKPTSIDAQQMMAPLQAVINDTQTLKLIYALNFGNGDRHPGQLGSGTPSIQTPT